MPDDNASGPTVAPSDKEHSVMLSADMFGDMVPKAGDKVTFCVTANPDSEGNIAGYFEAAGKPSPDEENEGSWEENFLREMSPRKG